MKVIFCGFTFALIALVAHMVEALFTISYYMMPEFFPVWSKLMMPKAGPPPLEFSLLSFLISLLSGIVLALLYERTKTVFPKKMWPRVISYTVIFFALGLVYWTLPLWLLINVPLGLLVSWAISSLVVTFLGTVVFAKVLK